MNTDVIACSTEQAVVVWAIENKQRLHSDEWKNLSQRIPMRLLQPILQLQRWEDRQASLFGKLLLQTGLRAIGEAPEFIGALEWDQYKRPYLPGNLDFNVAHTDGLVLCALTNSGRIGIDAEALKPVFIPDYKMVYTDAEYQNLLTNKNRIYTFYKYWTRKEAVMKADGRGFYLDPKTIPVESDHVLVDGKGWTIKSLQINESFICSVACMPEMAVILRRLTLEMLLSGEMDTAGQRLSIF